MSIRRSAYYWLFAADRYLARLPRGVSILDVGCSDGRGSETLRRRHAFGVDIYRPALVAGTRDKPVQADVRRLPYRADAFDVVVALDVVEHFDKADALGVLNELERVARLQVVVATPSGFMPQPGTTEEPWQEHRCGFEAAELEALGYRVSGFGGPRRWRGDYGKFRGGPAGKLAVLATDLTVRNRPARAFALLGVKLLPDSDQARTPRVMAPA